MSDAELVEAFLRDTIENPNPDPYETLTALMKGKEPDDMTQSVAFAIYASTRTIIRQMLKEQKSLRTIDHETMEITETERIPEDVESVLRSGSMVLALARDEGKYSPMYYVSALLDLITLDEEGGIDEARLAEAGRNVSSTIDSFTRMAIDNVRKGRYVTNSTAN